MNETVAHACSAKIAVLSTPIGLAGAFSEAESLARFGTWLRTTREARLKKREEDWTRQGRRTRIDSRVGSSTRPLYIPLVRLPLASPDPLELSIG